MHSRIFQVSLDPITKADYITESDYWEHWFTREIADYVDEDTNRNHDIEWFKSCCNGFVFDKDERGEYFIVEDKEKYFADKFKMFSEAVDKIKDYTLSGFTQGVAEMWGLRHAYEDRFGFYLDADGELMTLDRFVRGCAKGAKYYIGGTIDYHC